jgi:hypothetical protein
MEAVPWDPAIDIDWRVAPKRPRWLRARHHGLLVDQFIAGERTALATCRRLSGVLAQSEQPALTRQLADETRHVAVYTRYLARLGEAPTDAGELAHELAALDTWTGSTSDLLVAHHLLENEALAVHRELALWFPCPLLRQITRRIMRDEARHVGFGRALLARAATAPLDERAARYHRLRHWWGDCARAAARDYGGAVLARVAPGDALLRRWRRHRRVLVRIGLVDEAHPAFADPIR